MNRPPKDTYVSLAQPFRMRVYRCYRCGRYWAHETDYLTSKCASCYADDSLDEGLREEKLHRTVRRLRRKLAK